MTNEVWKIILYDGVISWIKKYPTEYKHRKELDRIISSIKSPICSDTMNYDTCKRTHGRIVGTKNVFEPEEIQMFERLLITRK